MRYGFHVVTDSDSPCALVEPHEFDSDYPDTPEGFEDIAAAADEALIADLMELAA